MNHRVIHPSELIEKEIGAFDDAMVGRMATILGSVGFIWFCIVLDLLGFIALIQQTVQALQTRQGALLLVSLWVAFIAQAVIQLIALPVLQNYANRQQVASNAKADADHRNMQMLVELQNEQMQELKNQTEILTYLKGVKK